MLQYFLFPELRLLNLFDRALFQQDGANFHYTSNVQSLMNDCFTHKWITSAGSEAWPTASPVPIPLDYFFYGVMLIQLCIH